MRTTSDSLGSLLAIWHSDSCMDRCLPDHWSIALSFSLCVCKIKRISQRLLRSPINGWANELFTPVSALKEMGNKRHPAGQNRHKQGHR